MFGFTAVALAALLSISNALPVTELPIVRTRATSPDIAAIMAVDPSTFPSYQTGGLIRHDSSTTYNNTGTSLTLSKRACPTTATLTWGDADNGGIGVLITNGGTDYYGFYIYENSCDSIPYKYIWIAGGATEYVSVYAGFQGRITRGTDAMNLAGVPQLLGTWVEFSFQGNVIWGDISLIRGCDQGALVWATDGSGSWKGFTQDILSGAPVGAWAVKPDGTWVLAPTEGSTADDITLNYELSAVGAEYAYIDDSHGNPVISSSNGRFGVFFDPGTI